MKFWTNRISTGNSVSFSSLVEKIAASRQQVKTASAPAIAEPEPKVAEKVEAEKIEPANEDNKMRTNVHGPEGSPADGNGEPEGDDEKKVVSAQIAAPRPAVRPSIPAVKTAPVAAKPGINPAAPKPAAPIAAKPAIPAAKPAPAINPAAPKPASAVNPAAAKPAINPAAPKTAPAVNPAAAKPAAPLVGKPAVNPAAPRPEVKVPALAASTEEIVVAEGESVKEETPETGKFPEPDREQMYKQEPEDGTAKTEKESSRSPQFIKIANLKPKAKAFLKRYWSMLYPTQYADAMTQDK